MFNKSREEKEQEIKDKLVREQEFEEAESFAKIGEVIEYLGVKVTVVGYHDVFYFFHASHFRPGIRVQWFDKDNRLQETFINNQKFLLIKKQ
jgi:hypothetical protein